MSHFSTIKTQLKEEEPLIEALKSLGYPIIKEEKFVKGYRGKFTAVDISMNLPGETKVGFKWDNNSNAYELVTDLDLWKFEIPVERFISKVTQMYAYNTIISKTKEDGYQIVEQKNKNDGSIELVLTKWDN
jgi:hypothetical protein